MPFTRDEFLDVFGAYNAAWWPIVALMWLTALAMALAWRGWLPLGAVYPATAHRRAVPALLAVNWAWAGVVYHWGFFAAINPAARLFGVLFVAEAVLLLWHGVVRGRLSFDSRPGGWGLIATTTVAYALVYPIAAMATGHPYPRVPTFGVPCPATLLTIGWFLSASGLPFTLAIVPLIWCGIGGSAAVLLGMDVDLALPIAGALLAVKTIRDGVHHGHFHHPLRLVHRHR